MTTSIRTYLWILLLGMAFGTTTAIASIPPELLADPIGGGQLPPPPPTGK